MTIKKKISVIFSFRNEVENLEKLISNIEISLKNLKHNFELIFINDSSDDGSLELLKKIKTKKKQLFIKIITTTRPFGNTQCILTGMEYADGAAIIYMDADLQEPPSLIPKMIRSWEKGKEIVHTIRIEREQENRGTL